MTGKKTIRPNRIGELRRAANLSQQQLADLLGIHSITVSKLERGKMKLTLDWMVKIAAALDVQPHEISNEFSLRGPTRSALSLLVDVIDARIQHQQNCVISAKEWLALSHAVLTLLKVRETIRSDGS